MIFPEIEFDPLFGERDRKIITFIVHSVIREYQNKLAPFPAFLASPIKKFTIQPTRPAGGKFQGYCNFLHDSIAILEWPLNMGGIMLTANSATIAHEIAHHIIQEYFGDNSAGNYNGVRLVHYAANGTTHKYTKRFWSPRFFFKYGIPSLTITMFDVAKLIEDAWGINHDIDKGIAPKGPHTYI